MSEEEAADAPALIAGARAGTTPTDVYITMWGRVLDDADPRVRTDEIRIRAVAADDLEPLADFQRVWVASSQ